MRSRRKGEPKSGSALDQEITGKAELQPYLSFDEACKMALKVEKHKKPRDNKPFTKPFSTIKLNTSTSTLNKEVKKDGNSKKEKFKG